MISVPSILAQLFWHAPDLLPAAVAVGALLLAAVVWLYAPQVRAVEGPWRWILPGIRIVTIIALAASLVKPVAMRLATPAERGELLVLVDRSRSMSIVDNTRTPAQLVALAEVLGKLPPGVRPDVAGEFTSNLERLRTLAADVKSAQDDLDYARVSGHDVELRNSRLHQAIARYDMAAKSLQARAELLPAGSELRRRAAELTEMPGTPDAWKGDIPSRIGQAITAATQFQSAADEQLYRSNAEARQACDEVAQLSRFELVQRALLRPDGLLARLRADAAVSAFGIADQPLPMDLPTGGQLHVASDTSPTAYLSDLTGGIARTVSGRNVRAVVLFSDGRQVGGDPTVVSGLVPGGVPVFTVAAATSTPPRDLAFGEVQVPSSVFAGQPFRVRAEIRHEGLSGFSVEVHLRTEDGAEQSKTVAVADGRRVTVDFNLTLAHAGAQRLQLWFPKVQGEVTDSNNHLNRWIKVVPQRMKVLLVAGSPAWDFQFLRNELSRSREIQLTSEVLDPGAPKLKVGWREIRQQDVVMLFDVPIKGLDPAQWDAVEQLAEREGGSVILVAGGVHLPAEYNKSAPIPVSQLLPYDVVTFTPAWRIWPGESPEFHFVPASRAHYLGLLRLADESEGGVSRWEQLPGCYRFVQLPDPGGEGWRRGVRPLLLESESRLPVLTEMRLGLGRSFFVGMDETWRWRYKQGERDQGRFWRQLVAYASDQPYFEKEGPLSLDADKIAAEPNEPIHIRARLSEETAASIRSTELEILRGGSVVEKVQMNRAGPAGSGRFGTTVTLPTGGYQLRWSIPSKGGKSLSVLMPLHIIPTDDAEMADVSGDERMLRKLADASGGQFLALDQVNTLPRRLAAVGDARQRFAELPLWDSPYLFGFVLGCLGVEWALRKRVGLA